MRLNARTLDQVSGRIYLNSRWVSRRIIVASIVAQSLPSANGAAEQTVNVRPGRLTSARALINSQAAGPRRLTLNSTLRTAEPAGINVYAAYPHALSRIVVTMPACI